MLQSAVPPVDQQQWMAQQYMPDQQSHYSMHHMPQTYEEVRTLWVGDLQYWMDENYLRSCFLHTGEQVLSAKVIRNKITMMPEGYGFVEFASHSAAERVLQTYNGTIMPQTEQAFRLNWASYGLTERRVEGGGGGGGGGGYDHSIFVGDLAPDVTDYVLLETFRSRYQSVKGAKVVVDPSTARSKGYGFVRFGEEGEKNRAMTEMNGVFCSTRPMRISAATPKKSSPLPQQQYSSQKAPTAVSYQSPVSYPAQSYVADNDPNNTTLFVGGLDPNVTEEELRQLFGQFGDLIYVKIPFGKGCGFVQYMHRSCAEEALQKIQGCYIGQNAIRLSWGRSPTNKQQPTSWMQSAVDPNQWTGNYYGYGQYYDGYGYAQAAQDPGAYMYPNYAEYNYNYPQQGETPAGASSNTFQEYREEDTFDPLAAVDIEKMNVSYMASHESLLLARQFWMKSEEASQVSESG